MPIDGVHCRIEEPRPFSTKWSSHKFGGKPGVNYELVLRIDKDELLSVVGPIPAGKLNDLSTFRSDLKQRMPLGKKLIGDDG